MDLKALAAKALARGILLRIIYRTNSSTVSWALVCGRDLVNKTKIGTQIQGDFVDLIREKEFILDKDVLGFDYISLPQGTNYQDIFGQTAITQKFGEMFLLQEASYIESIKKAIAAEYSNYISFYTSQVDLYENCSEDVINDLFYIRYYPVRENITREELIKRIKTEVLEKYHICRDDEAHPLAVLKYFGLSNSALKNNDSSFICSLKKAWFDLMKKHAKITLINLSTELARYELEFQNFEKLQSVYGGIFTKEDISSFIHQFKEYKKMLDGLDISILDKCVTTEDVLSTWPAIIQPQPFLIDEY